MVLMFLKNMLNMKTRTITIKEALSEGYRLCGIQSNEFQCLSEIKNLTDEDLANSENDYYLADKHGDCYSFNKDEISELLAETISVNESEDTGRDTDEIYKAIKAINFKNTQLELDKVLSQFVTYKLTDIKLI
jgi:hypothetical protein